jgi:succinate dehydrogenase hydrophobic anchor subunit
MKNKLISIATGVILMILIDVIFYLFVAIMNTDINAFHWSAFSRYLYVSISLLIGLMVAIASGSLIFFFLTEE